MSETRSLRRFVECEPVEILSQLSSPIYGVINGSVKSDGSGTFIGERVMMTAWHVIAGLAIQHGFELKEDKEYRYGLMDLEELQIYVKRQVSAEDEINFKATHIFRSAFSNDIVIVLLNAVSAREGEVWGKPVKSTILDFLPPFLEKEVVAFGYTDHEDVSGKTGNDITQDIKAIVSPGIITNVYPEFMGSNNPFPGFIVETDILGGMSGGAIFDPESIALKGVIVASISEGVIYFKAGDELPYESTFDKMKTQMKVRIPENSPLSKAAYLWPILGDRFSSADMNGGEPFSVYDLANCNGDLKKYEIRIVNENVVQLHLDDDEVRCVELLDYMQRRNDANYPTVKKSVRYARNVQDILENLPEDLREAWVIS